MRPVVRIWMGRLGFSSDHWPFLPDALALRRTGPLPPLPPPPPRPPDGGPDGSKDRAGLGGGGPPGGRDEGPRSSRGRASLTASGRPLNGGGSNRRMASS